MPRIPSRPPLELSGKWAVVELPSMPDAYLSLTPDPHVLITHTVFERFSATFQFAGQHGEIDGRVDEVWTHAAAIFFTFVGTDDGAEISGAAADAGYNAADDTITGTMRYHQGDDMPFVLKRVTSSGGSKKPAEAGRKKRRGKA
jgi:hypothetical protein